MDQQQAFANRGGDFAQTDNRPTEIHIQESLQISANIPGIGILDQTVYQKEDSVEKITSFPQASTVDVEEMEMTEDLGQI